MQAVTPPTIGNKQQLTYFIADLHLAENRPDITACFLAFLHNDANQAEKLYILGDLFETWVGDDDDSPWLNELTDALATLSESGTQLYFIHGNRDFMLGLRFARKAKLQLLDEICQVELYGNRAVIMHGDTLCTRDVAYQQFRKKSRSWWWQALIRSLPLFVRKKIAANYRQQSAAATAMKAPEIMDVTETEVVACLQHYRCQLLIHGHTHRPNVHQLHVNEQPAQRIVLGDWYQQGSWLKVTPEGFELLSRPLHQSCKETSTAPQ